jgi:hypothetical protein
LTLATQKKKLAARWPIDAGVFHSSAIVASELSYLPKSCEFCLFVCRREQTTVVLFCFCCWLLFCAFDSSFTSAPSSRASRTKRAAATDAGPWQYAGVSLLAPPTGRRSKSVNRRSSTPTSAAAAAAAAVEDEEKEEKEEGAAIGPETRSSTYEAEAHYKITNRLMFKADPSLIELPIKNRK